MVTWWLVIPRLPAAVPPVGNGYAGLRLRTTRRTKGSAHIAHAYSHQVLTELKTFLFYHSTFLTGGTDASRARLRDVHFLALCSS